MLTKSEVKAIREAFNNPGVQPHIRNDLERLLADCSELEKEYDYLVDVYRGVLQKSTVKIQSLREQLKEAVSVLEELSTLVRGECPSLLNDDSDGCSRLELEIDAVLACNADTT